MREEINFLSETRVYTEISVENGYGLNNINNNNKNKINNNNNNNIIKNNNNIIIIIIIYLFYFYFIIIINVIQTIPVFYAYLGIHTSLRELISALI